jgi:hypothetical protein
MTKHPNNSVAVGPNGVWPTDARLVDGNTTRDGRLDLKYNGKWRGVCTNYNKYVFTKKNCFILCWVIVELFKLGYRILKPAYVKTNLVQTANICLSDVVFVSRLINKM